MSYRIALDPGHPPHGTKALGLVESVYTWEMANFVKSRLDHSGEPFEVQLLRLAVDEAVNLDERGRRSEAFGAELILHLHVNWNNRSDVHGCEAYYWPGNLVGQEVGDSVLRAMSDVLRHPSRVAMAARDTSAPEDDWLRNARAVMEPHAATSCLVELGYCSSPRDLRALLSPAVQSAICAALMVGVACYRVIRERG